mgnify:CR=1 FL=1
MIQNLKRRLAPYYRNLGGWRTKRRLVVIESDDWGSIRMPSREVYEWCLKSGYPVDQTAFERYDSLLSETDLELLFDALSALTDRRGRHPVINANTIMGNPDFNAIAESGYARYAYEPIRATFARYPQHANCLDLWAEGQRQGVFFPQFHGREHLNVGLFMQALQAGDPVARFAFDNQMPGCIPHGPVRGPNKYVETTRFFSAETKAEVLKSQLEGLAMFEAEFGFRSRTLIPTNYVWSSDFDSAVAEQGVEAFQGARVMKEQSIDGTSRPVKRHLGQRNAAGQTYLVRNATFEPSQSTAPRMEAAERCLQEISAAFRMGKPAIISSHRINFCGFIDESNRDQNLRALNALLTAVVRKWPDVEFVTSVELLDIMNGR